MDISKINGEQYCMHCDYWRKMDGGYRCTNSAAKCVWFANQLNGCDYFHGKLQPKQDWSKAHPVGYRPGIFS